MNNNPITAEDLLENGLIKPSEYMLIARPSLVKAEDLLSHGLIKQPEYKLSADDLLEKGLIKRR